MEVVSDLKQIFKDHGGKAMIPQQRSTPFNAWLEKGGISVDCLGNQGFLPFKVFTETISLLESSEDGKAPRGNCRVRDARLGDSNVPLDSVEGHVALKVFDAKIGDSVFMRVSAIANLLVWAGVCEHGRGYLKLKK